jgi:hypothetical protein
VHDVLDYEARGVPGVIVATTEFVDAAAAQGRSLGGAAACVFVEHPIQDRTDDEMRTIADGVVEDLLRLLKAPA